MHRKLAFSTLAHDTLGITPLAAGVVTTLRTSTKNSVRKLIDYTTYIIIEVSQRYEVYVSFGAVCFMILY